MKSKGFTLVELAVVIGIIGLLISMTLPVFLHGGLDEGVSTLQSSIFSAKTFAITKRKRCMLILNADYYLAPNYSSCTLIINDMQGTFKKEYQLPKYIRFWQYELVGNSPENFTNGTKTIYFEPFGISHGTENIIIPQNIIITLKDTKTGSAIQRTIIGSTCQIK